MPPKPVKCYFCDNQATGYCSKCHAAMCPRCFSSHTDVPACQFKDCNNPAVPGGVFCSGHIRVVDRKTFPRY